MQIVRSAFELNYRKVASSGRNFKLVYAFERFGAAYAKTLPFCRARVNLGPSYKVKMCRKVDLSRVARSLAKLIGRSVRSL